MKTDKFIQNLVNNQKRIKPVKRSNRFEVHVATGPLPAYATYTACQDRMMAVLEKRLYRKA